VDPELAIALQVAAARGKVPQATVAREMGMTKQAYQRLEDPKANLSVKMLKRIAESMGKRLEVQFV
ncbi:MAG: helix-turn-helix transcriptional regulator, partial [Fibrobacter sp.]|nr:helix-turn-helix transcriptional regulator [Fibrobacter sp.]